MIAGSKHGPGAWLFRILCAGVAAPIAANLARLVYRTITGLPPVDWSITGRWFLMVLSGQPYAPGIGTAAPLPHELLVGTLGYHLISITFAAVYLIGLALIGRRETFANGLVFGWVTMAFPFLVQMPLMGLGVFASLTPTPWILLGRTLVHHTGFGLGLALGAMLADAVLRRRK